MHGAAICPINMCGSTPITPPDRNVGRVCHVKSMEFWRSKKTSALNAREVSINEIIIRCVFYCAVDVHLRFLGFGYAVFVVEVLDRLVQVVCFQVTSASILPQSLITGCNDLLAFA